MNLLEFVLIERTRLLPLIRELHQNKRIYFNPFFFIESCKLFLFLNRRRKNHIIYGVVKFNKLSDFFVDHHFRFDHSLGDDFIESHRDDAGVSARDIFATWLKFRRCRYFNGEFWTNDVLNKLLRSVRPVVIVTLVDNKNYFQAFLLRLCDKCPKVSIRFIVPHENILVCSGRRVLFREAVPIYKSNLVFAKFVILYVLKIRKRVAACIQILFQFLAALPVEVVPGNPQKRIPSGHSFLANLFQKVCHHDRFTASGRRFEDALARPLFLEKRFCNLYEFVDGGLLIIFELHIIS